MDWTSYQCSVRFVSNINAWRQHVVWKTRAQFKHSPEKENKKTSVTRRVPASRENSGHSKWGITWTAQWKGLINCNNTITEREWGRRANIMTFPEWASCLLMWSVFFHFIAAPPQFYQLISLLYIFFLCYSLLVLSLFLSLSCGLHHVFSPVWEKSKNSWGISTPAKSGAEQHLPTNQRITEIKQITRSLSNGI